MKHLKPGDICIVDRDNTRKLKIYKPLYVRIVKRYGINKYHCVNVTDLEPIYRNRFMINSNLIIPKHLLTKIDDETISRIDNVSLRLDTNVPVITDKDMEALFSVIKKAKENDEFSEEEIKKLKIIYYKLDLYNEIGRDMYGLYKNH